MRFLPFFSVLFLACASSQAHDVVIYGGTPAGIMAAVAASREGASVVILEPSRWLGGMVAGGLSSSDLGNPDCIGGLALEFFDRCGQHYPGQPKWYCEPHVYQQVFAEMLAEAGVETYVGRAVKSVQMDHGVINLLETDDGRFWEGSEFIDASYEGDLMEKVGVANLWGRESRDQYHEELAGFRLEQPREFPPEVMTQGCPCVGDNGPHYVHGAPTRISALFPGGGLIPGVVESHAAAGSADKLTQSYNFRLCATHSPENLVPWPKPARYDAKRYELLLRLIQAYPGIKFTRLFHLGILRGEKFDLNAQGLFSTDYVGGNINWYKPDPGTRYAIFRDHVDYTQGLFWFLAHDERVPAELRHETATWGLCQDEFTDNDHWSYALYVREARRMIGAYVMTQRDVQRDIFKPDSIGMGSFIIDSHIVQRVVSDDGIVLDEGAFDAPTRPYQIPYRSLTPKREECENLLVPVCLSASHVAYDSIRMEPVYMEMGHAAGVAAAMALHANKPVQAIDVPALQAKLKTQKQVLELASLKAMILPEKLPGIVQDDDDAKLTGVWTTSGYGNPVGGSSRHDANGGKGHKSARYELPIPTAGRYEVRVSYSPAANRATNVPITITHAEGTARATLNQRQPPPLENGFASLGAFSFAPAHPAVVEISNAGTDGYVVIDCVQLLPVK